MVWTQSQLRPFWRLQSVNRWHPAPSTSVSMSLCQAATLRTITGRLLVWAQPLILAMQRQSLALPCQRLASPLRVGFWDLSHVGEGAEGSRTSSNRFLTRSEIKEALCGATGELVADLTQAISETLKPLIPPHESPMTIGASPHRLQANHLVAGLTHTLDCVRR